MSHSSIESQMAAQKPSERILFALDALEEAEKSPHFEIDMHRYHTIANDTGICFACLGGCASIKLLKGGFDTKFTNEDVPDFKQSDVVRYEKSLNALRIGEVGLSFQIMNLDRGEGACYDRHITQYYNNPEQFKVDMLKLVNDLKEDGY